MTEPLIQQFKSYPAKKLAKGALFCPACQLRLEEPVHVCPSCQFTGQHTLNLFPGGAPVMETMIDPEQFWDTAARKRLEKKLSELRRLFPQVHWCLLSISLPEQTPLRLFNFWFFNVSPIEAPATADQRAWTILLTLDAKHRRVSVMPGYAIEPMIADDEWEKVLLVLRESERKGDMLAGYLQFFEETKQLLIKASERMRDIIAHEEGRGE